MSTLAIILLALAAWFVLSIPVGVLVGKFLHRGSR
jgi:ABC-type proline/glycine betaine transport system permease subunit